MDYSVMRGLKWDRMPEVKLGRKSANRKCAVVAGDTVVRRRRGNFLFHRCGGAGREPKGSAGQNSMSFADALARLSEMYLRGYQESLKYTRLSDSGST